MNPQTTPPASSDAPSCSAIYRTYQEAHSKIYARYCRDVKAARDRDFQPGTKVTWEHGRLTIKGTVVKLCNSIHEDVEVRRDGSGSTVIRKKARELKLQNAGAVTRGASAPPSPAKEKP
jgi:hypothetical protein